MGADVRDDARRSRDFLIACASYAQLLETIKVIRYLDRGRSPVYF